MDFGPVTYMVVEFPGNQFKGEIAPAIKDLADNGIIRVMDMVLVKKDNLGVIEAIELNEHTPEINALFGDVNPDTLGLLTEADLATLSGALDRNSSAGILVFENLWARRFAETIANAGGRWVMLESVPTEVLAEALATRSGAV